MEVLELKNTVLEISNVFCGIISRLDTTEGRNKELENRATKIIQIEI